MINPNAQLVKQTCARCGAECKILVLPLCDLCLPLLKSWEQLKEWTAA